MVEAAGHVAVALEELQIFGKPRRRRDHGLDIVEIDGLDQAFGVAAVIEDRSALGQHVEHVAEAGIGREPEIAVEARALGKAVSAGESEPRVFGRHGLVRECDAPRLAGRSGGQRDAARIVLGYAVKPFIGERRAVAVERPDGLVRHHHRAGVPVRQGGIADDGAHSELLRERRVRANTVTMPIRANPRITAAWKILSLMSMATTCPRKAASERSLADIVDHALEPAIAHPLARGARRADRQRGQIEFAWNRNGSAIFMLAIAPCYGCAR